MSTDKPPLAKAIVDLRARFGENQQRFSDRLKVAMATVARWEIGERRPSPRYLKELWHLSAEQDRADLAQVFSDAFAQAVGYTLSGEGGMYVQRLVTEIRLEVGQLLFANLEPEERQRVARILEATGALYSALREMDLEPPFRAFVRHKKGEQK
jgi:transcriptional regulator with XRE-family HTH domain